MLNVVECQWLSSNFTFEMSHDYFDIEKSNVIMILNFTMIHNNDSQ